MYEGDEAMKESEINLKDGGIIEPPEDDGAIRRRDVDGNMMEVRTPDDDDYDEWKQLFTE